MPDTVSHTVVIGADPAGLTAAYELSKREHDVTLLSANDAVGGLFRTEHYQGYCIDLGVGGFSTQEAPVQQLWDELVGEESVEVEVRSLIHFHHRLFKYPLSATNAFKHLGPIDIALTGISHVTNWLASQPAPIAEAQTSKAWIDRRFGPHFNRTFFEPYFEKVWGLSTCQLAPEVARQSLTKPGGKDGTLVRLLIDTAITPATQSVTYPRQGYSHTWNKCKALIEQAGATLAPSTKVIKLEHTGETHSSHQRGHRITQVIATAGENIQTIPVNHLVCSLPLPELVTCLDAPATVQTAAQQLKYRHLIQVALVLEVADLFYEQSIYINSQEVLVSRIHNFKNWSADTVPNSQTTCLGLTYLCDETDTLWEMDSPHLIQLASQELVKLGLIESFGIIESGTVMRQPQAYPIHTTQTFQHLAVVQNYLEGFENLQTVGRCGLHRFAPLDNYMLSGQQAAENILSKRSGQPSHTRHNLWKNSSRASVTKASITF